MLVASEGGAHGSRLAVACEPYVGGLASGRLQLAAPASQRSYAASSWRLVALGAPASFRSFALPLGQSSTTRASAAVIRHPTARLLQHAGVLGHPGRPPPLSSSSALPLADPNGARQRREAASISGPRSASPPRHAPPDIRIAIPNLTCVIFSHFVCYC